MPSQPPNSTPANTNSPSDEQMKITLKSIRIKQEQDAVRLQILIGKLERTAGNNTPAPILMGALCHMTAMLIGKRFPPSKHTSLMRSFVQGVETALHSTYPPELIAQVRKERADQLANSLADQMEHALKKAGTIGDMSELTTGTEVSDPTSKSASE